MKSKDQPPTGRDFSADDDLNNHQTGSPAADTAASIREHTDTNALPNAEAMLAGIMDSAMDAIITVDERFRIVFFNRSAEMMFRCEASNALGTPLDRFIPDRFRPDHSGFISNFGETGTTTRAMLGSTGIFGLRANGEEFPAEASISQLDAGGQKLFTVMMRDITFRVAADQELKKQALILDRAPVIVFDPEFRIVRWSTGASEMFGFTADEAVGQLGLELFNTVYSEPRDEVIAEFFRLGTWIGELTLYGKDGRELIVATKWVLHRDRDGNPQTVLALHTDITERKRAERQLLESEQRYRRLFANNPWPMWVFDVETLAFLEVNQAAVRQYGYSREEFLAMTLTHIRPPEDVENFLRSTRQFDDDLSVTELWRHRRKNGDIIAVEINAHAIDFAGRRGRLVLAYDVTERLGLEEQLRQSQKMEAIGQLAGGIAHDFNNLLTVINGYTDLSIRQLAAEDPLRHNLQEIANAGDRAAALTHQLLAFGRKQVLQPQATDLNSLVEELERMLHRLIGDDVTLVTRLESGLWRVMADPGQINQIVMNLAINARDAMPNGGRLTIGTRNAEIDEAYASSHIEMKPGRYVMLYVCDTGTGMTPEVRERIFDPFFTTKLAGKGTGLGLSTVYGIVKQSGGAVWVYSEPGQGATFKIYLPMVKDAAAVSNDARHVSAPPQGNETVLVAEDSEQVRHLTSSILSLYGYHVLEAESGESAIALCEQHPGDIDLLITDVVMPGISGTELAELVKDHRPNIKVLHMSGYTDSNIVHRGVLAEGANFLQKPFTSEILARKVRDVLDQTAR